MKTKKVIVRANVILQPRGGEIDDKHIYVTRGPNSWGAGATPQAALEKCKVHTSRDYKGPFQTVVVPKSFEVDPVDGCLAWDAEGHKECPICTGGKVYVELQPL